MDELPAKLEDLFHFSFNFDNLIKIISFLGEPFLDSIQTKNLPCF